MRGTIQHTRARLARRRPGRVARRLPAVSFVLVGNCSLPEGWCPHPNVTRVPQVPFESVARYMAAMDALIMPWNDSDWIRACNPIKLKEYLAVGRPVVTTDFPALAPYRDLVRVASGVEDFTAALRSALAEPYDAARVLPHLTGESWGDKADLLADTFAALGWTAPARSQLAA